MTFDKFLNRSIQILLSCVMVVSITIITLLFTPVYVHADDETNAPLIPYYNSGGQPSQYVIENYGIKLFEGTADSVSQSTYVISSNREDLTTGLLVDNGTLYALLCIPPNTSSSVNVWFKSFGSTVYNFLGNSVSTDNYTSSNGNTYQVAKRSIGSNYDTSGLLFEPFTSVEQYLDYLEGGSSGSVSFSRTISIKPGYVAYVQTAGGTLDLVAQFHEYSRFSRPLWDNGIRISFNGGLAPTSGTIFNESFGSPVDWLKVASAPSNLLGQTMTGGYSYTAGLPDAGSNKCVVIYNPAYGNANTLVGNGTIDLGVYVTATFSNLVDVTQYKLRADATVTYSSGAAVLSGSPDDYNLAYTYIPSDNDPSDVVTDSDYKLLDISSNTSGPAIDMNAGGYNGTSDYDNNNPEEAENGILGLLTRILKFLSAPITHIMSLFNAGGNFMAWLGQLWTWLPSDVGAILVDALIVLIVIGAIKFLWK